MDEAVVESVVSRCEELTPAECVTFLEKGYLVIKRAFPRAVAAHAVVEQAWRSLEADAGIAHRINRAAELHSNIWGHCADCAYASCMF